MNYNDHLSDIFAGLLFPRRCPVCDKPVRPFGRLICTSCIPQIRYVHGPRCYKCGKPLADETEEYCEDCSRHAHSYDQGMSLFEYRSAADSIYRFKYRGRREYAKFYGQRMYIILGERIQSLGVQAFIPVPIHKSKLRSRGYNQARLLACELSKHTGIPVMDSWIIRSRKTTPLKDLTPAERNNNLRGAFKMAHDGVKLETIMIVDDIYTTGATIDAMSAILRACGVKKIYFATLAIGQGV